MLAPEFINVIKQATPALAAHAETLTRHFYRRMFAGNPEVKPFFNPAHQHTGSQQKALAGAICAYATHIARPEALAPALEVIAQKHASLGVMPEHYPIVGEHLLASIREVLAAAATEEVINAWAAAYGVLADLLIKREAEIYQEHKQQHGWQGFETFVIQKKQTESEIITSFYLAPASIGAKPRTFRPGQYITVRVPSEDGGTTMRNYSLSGPPGTSHYRISVKRESAKTAAAPHGQVSHYLHRHVNEGDRIQIGPPCGGFTLKAESDPSRPLVFISGGAGITPLLSMLHAALERGGTRDIWFIHGVINGDTHAFRQEVLDLADQQSRVRVHFRYSEPTRQESRATAIRQRGVHRHDAAAFILDGPDAKFYFCGPVPFMSCLYQGLLSWGVSLQHLNYEFFGPGQGLREPGQEWREVPATAAV